MCRSRVTLPAVIYQRCIYCFVCCDVNIINGLLIPRIFRFSNYFLRGILLLELADYKDDLFHRTEMTDESEIEYGCIIPRQVIVRIFFISNCCGKHQ